MTSLSQPWMPLPIEAGVKADGLVLRSHWEAGGETWVEAVYAAPQARFAGPLVRKVAEGLAEPFVEVAQVGKTGACTDFVIRLQVGRGSVEGTRMLVYRITGYDFQTDVYTGEWPD